MRCLAARQIRFVAVVTCGIALLVACGVAKAGPLVFVVSGTGHVHVNNLSGPAEDKTSPITLGTGSLDAGGGLLNLTSASLSWDIQSNDSSARMAMGLKAFGGRGGDGLSEATVRFMVDRPVFFRLVLNVSEYGNVTDASIDANKVGFTFNFMNPEPNGEKVISGPLGLGEHVFAVSTFAGQTRSNPLLSDGTATLDIATAPVLAIPLPAAVYPGGAVLIAMAGIGWRRRRAV